MLLAPVLIQGHPLPAEARFGGERAQRQEFGEDLDDLDRFPHALEARCPLREPVHLPCPLEPLLTVVNAPPLATLEDLVPPAGHEIPHLRPRAQGGVDVPCRSAGRNAGRPVHQIAHVPRTGGVLVGRAVVRVPAHEADPQAQAPHGNHHSRVGARQLRFAMRILPAKCRRVLGWLLGLAPFCLPMEGVDGHLSCVLVLDELQGPREVHGIRLDRQCKEPCTEGVGEREQVPVCKILTFVAPVLGELLPHIALQDPTAGSQCLGDGGVQSGVVLDVNKHDCHRVLASSCERSRAVGSGDLLADPERHKRGQPLLQGGWKCKYDLVLLRGTRRAQP
mmetsp:Transcript_30958/g.86733  ORF Transcript_30958/g.86733 Transcript_30958/m.86733 type:complete len:335 (-) Transcript_30958:1453-2457(-)